MEKVCMCVKKGKKVMKAIEEMKSHDSTKFLMQIN